MNLGCFLQGSKTGWDRAEYWGFRPVPNSFRFSSFYLFPFVFLQPRAFPHRNNQSSCKKQTRQTNSAKLICRPKTKQNRAEAEENRAKPTTILQITRVLISVSSAKLDQIDRARGDRQERHQGLAANCSVILLASSIFCCQTCPYSSSRVESNSDQIPPEYILSATIKQEEKLL